MTAPAHKPRDVIADALSRPDPYALPVDDPKLVAERCAKTLAEPAVQAAPPPKLWAEHNAKIAEQFPATILDTEADDRWGIAVPRDVLFEADADNLGDDMASDSEMGAVLESKYGEHTVPITASYDPGSAAVRDTGQPAIYGPDDAPAIPPDDPIEALAPLHAEMEGMRIRYSELGAMHGPGGKFDAVRKEVLSSIKSELFAKYAPGLGKPMPAMADRVDAESHADGRYHDFLAASRQEHQEYNALALRLAMLRDRIIRTNSLLHLSAAQARLG